MPVNIYGRTVYFVVARLYFIGILTRGFKKGLLKVFIKDRNTPSRSNKTLGCCFGDVIDFLNFLLR